MADASLSKSLIVPHLAHTLILYHNFSQNASPPRSARFHFAKGTEKPCDSDYQIHDAVRIFCSVALIQQ